ncbi:MAG: prolyl oligopeptidase family serine peptidase [Candidatus Hydrogenedentes bacterium]|nr:prolyl oligopeptidase family serine peptidase [Candidatus Hydrogenedentota bacterium]
MTTKHYLCRVIFAVAVLAAWGVAEEPCCGCGPDGTQDSGAIYRICMPPEGEWNGGLIVYAHGYMAFNEPFGIPEDQLEFDGGISVPEIITGLGYAFAVTSYSVNGLAVKEGLADVVDLVDVFTEQYGAPSPVYIVGVSEGGLVTALAVENYPDVFDGGVCACGPIGDFTIQMRWFGDFRVALDYYFPGLLPGSVENVPAWLIDSWGSYYEDTVRPALFDPNNARKLRQLVALTHTPFDMLDYRASLENSLKDLLWYNVFATNDATAKLGGLPFDNQSRRYGGVPGTFRLNREIARYSASDSALDEIAAHYQTSGRLERPLVSIHTLWDPQVPYTHMAAYRAKTLRTGSASQYTHIPVVRYDHCEFKESEVLLAFALLVLRVEGTDAVISLALDSKLSSVQEKSGFRALAKQYGLPLEPAR